MQKLIITQAKPNPLGKDRFGHLTPAVQLAGEWVDFKNSGDESYPLGNIKLQHVAYSPRYPNGVWEEVINFSGSLPVGETVRVHSGNGVPLNSLPPIDVRGADYHIFTGKNYVWNNDRSDTPRLKDVLSRTTVDEATYSANPPEGRILVRRGDYLL